MHWIQNITNNVEKFIDEFMGGQHGSNRTQEILRSKFINGYCYYFAHMLKIAFNRGTVCWAAPFGHFVWLDTNDKAYDIEGLYDLEGNEGFYLIPEKYLKKYIHDFLHTEESKNHKSASKKDLIKIVQKYCHDYNIEYDSSIEDWFYDP